MARLNDIEIRESAVTYSNQRGWFFHATGHHVRALVLHFLPPNYILDGSSKLSVIFGERPPREQRYSQVLGVSIYYVDNFDIPLYMGRTRAEQQEIILVELTNAMLEVARATGVDVAPIETAAAAVRKNAFQCEIEISKLSRVSQDRRVKIKVVRRLGPATGESWEAVISNSAGVVLGLEQIKEPGCLDRTGHFSKSQWHADVFQIVSGRLKEVQYELDVGKYR